MNVIYVCINSKNYTSYTILSYYSIVLVQTLNLVPMPCTSTARLHYYYLSQLDDPHHPFNTIWSWFGSCCKYNSLPKHIHISLKESPVQLALHRWSNAYTILRIPHHLTAERSPHAGDAATHVTPDEGPFSENWLLSLINDIAKTIFITSSW